MGRRKWSNTRSAKVSRWAVRMLWRHRTGLMPLWWCLALLTIGWAAGWLWPAWWPLPVSAGLAGAGLLWFHGPRLSPHAQRIWLALVPDALDDGETGVLDRPTERGYLALLLLGGGGWLSARMQYGLTPPVASALGGLLVVLGAPWWWHRGWRRRRPMNTWARRWARVNGNDDLKPWHGSTVTEVTGKGRAVTLTVKLRAGRTVDHVGAHSLILCSVLGLRPGAVSVAKDLRSARRVLVRVVPRDPWSGALPHPLPAFGTLTLTEQPRVMVGRYEDGTPCDYQIGQHTLTVGQTGAGKSAWLETLLTWILAFGDAAVVAADLASAATLGVWEPALSAPLATDVASAYALIWQVFEEIERRERLLAARKKAGELIDSLPPTPELPWLWFIIDEFPDLIKGAKLEGVDAITILERLANKGRKTGVWLVLGAQNPGVTDVGSTVLRGALTGTIGLGLNETQSQTLWGTSRRQGWDSTGLTIGTFLLRDRDVEHQTPRVAKGLWVSPTERGKVIAAAAENLARLDRKWQWVTTGQTSLELREPDGNGAGIPPGSRPRLTVVPGGNSRVLPAGNPAGTVTAGREPGAGFPEHMTRAARSAELDSRVFAEIPDAHQGGIGGTAIATQLQVSPDRVKRSFQRLAKAGKIQPHPSGDRTWCRT